MCWVTATHAMRYHAHDYHSGVGNVYQGRFEGLLIPDGNSGNRRNHQQRVLTPFV